MYFTRVKTQHLLSYGMVGIYGVLPENIVSLASVSLDVGI